MLEKMAEEAISSNGFVQDLVGGSNQPAVKKKRNLPGTPDPEAEVIALSPKTLMATNRFLCEICGKGFQRDQNLQLHRRGHNLPWKLKQRTTKEARKRVYVCPEKTCVHNHPSRALGDLTGIKKHFCRKHGEKKWKCEKCSKRYAVQSDWKAHSKTCGTREYKCDCGTLFSRRDSFITHRAFCDALAEETARVNAASKINGFAATSNINYHLFGTPVVGPNMAQHFSSIFKPAMSSNDQLIIDPTRRGFSWWMTDGHHEPIGGNVQEIHSLGSLSSEVILENPIVSRPINAPPSEYQLNWPDPGNNKFCSNNAEELTSTALPLICKEAADQIVSVPSLYSTQKQSHQMTSSASMSATALLQKAAEIGATSSDPSFLGSLGLKYSNSHVQDRNKYSGFYGSNPNMSNNLGNDVVENSGGNDVCSSLNHQQQQLHMCPMMKRQKLQSDDHSAGGEQTRDFLGVGVQTISHPPSINGWI